MIEKRDGALQDRIAQAEESAERFELVVSSASEWSEGETRATFVSSVRFTSFRATSRRIK